MVNFALDSSSCDRLRSCNDIVIGSGSMIDAKNALLARTRRVSVSCATTPRRRNKTRTKDSRGGAKRANKNDKPKKKKTPKNLL